MLQYTLLQAQPFNQRNNLFDEGWRFHRGGLQGAENPGFDDSAWREVDLPHDWSIENLPGTDSPFDRAAISQVSGGFTTGGTGWYRKTFILPETMKGKRITILFEGVYMNATVWLNGRELGNHPYGYTSFGYDLTPGIRFGEKNTLAVKVVNEGENSRWYSGSGIYRHVWLGVTGPVHVTRWGTFVSTPEVNATSALAAVRTTLVNSGDASVPVKLVTRILDPSGREVASAETTLSLRSTTPQTLYQELRIPSPLLWSVDKPRLYMAVTEVHLKDGGLSGAGPGGTTEQGGGTHKDITGRIHDRTETNGGWLCDRTETRFGIRTIAFDVAKGFLLNGRSLELKGGCVHHDNGPLGAKAFDRAEERRVELLKASGFNAIRCAHNPPSPAFLDACDRLGMLVIDEAFDMWETGKNPYDYHLWFTDWWQKDVESMVLRDRNHPCVILWSTGNEIPERGNARGAELSAMIGGFIRKLDPTRPVTSAVNGLHPDKDPYFATLDVAGYNYAAGGDHNRKSVYEEDHARVPQRIIYCAESYPLEAFGSWMGVLDHPWVVGDFVWTAFDYIGEASIGWLGYWMNNSFFPWNLAFCGDIDICGWKRPQSYYRDALWKENQLSLFVRPPKPSFVENPARQDWSKWHWHDAVASWNWEGHEGQPLEVTAYSSCPETELFLNGKSLGREKDGPLHGIQSGMERPLATGRAESHWV